MKGVDTIARIWREFFILGRSIKGIVRKLHVSAIRLAGFAYNCLTTQGNHRISSVFAGDV